jgi:DNA-directed RNA polymerase subunit K/omega
MTTIEKQIKNKEEEDIDVSDVEEDMSEAEESDAEESDASEAVESDAVESDLDEEDEDPDQEDPEEDPSEETGSVPLKKETKRTTVVNGIEMLKATKKTQPIIYEDDEEEDEDEVNYLQKFDSTMRDNFILDHHPEARTHNYEEVKALSRVSRDGRGIIIDPLHKTIPFLTKYEMTRVIGQRAKQLDSGARAFVKVPLNVLDGYLIALLELEQKKLPFIIKRPYPNGGVEYWNVSDLELLL